MKKLRVLNFEARIIKKKLVICSNCIFNCPAASLARTIRKNIQERDYIIRKGETIDLSSHGYYSLAARQRTNTRNNTTKDITESIPLLEV